MSSLAPSSRSEIVASSATRPADALLPAEVVGEIADKINRIYALGGLQTAIEIGRYVLSVLAPATSAAESLAKSASYRALARHPSLAVSHSFLWTAVSVALQFNRLPLETRALPLSHHRLLVSVRDPQQKQALAKQCYREGWSKRELSRRIREWSEKEDRSNKPRRGRPAIPEAVKQSRALINVIDRLAIIVEGDELADRQEVEAAIASAIARLNSLRVR